MRGAIADGAEMPAAIGRGRGPMLLAAIACCCWLLLIGQCAGQKPINLGGSKKRDVYIAGFFPYGNHVPEGHIGRGVMPAVKLAVEHINEHPTILRDYRLHMWWNDTEVSETIRIRHRFRFHSLTRPASGRFTSARLRSVISRHPRQSLLFLMSSSSPIAPRSVRYS